jgi:NTE family protein
VNKRRVCLGLQGGGSHGAFTWGVLDALLAEDRFEIAALSGSSAGAMNAVLLAHGWTTGKAAGARESLRGFWERVASSAPFGAMAAAAAAWGMPLASGAETPDLQALRGFMHLAHYFSPYEFNPFDINPLRDIVAECIDFERLRSACPIDLFIGATEVRSGRLRIFTTAEMRLEVLLASACLPTIHHSVEIEGKAYWDGGLTANPPVFPLLHTSDADDLVLVLLQGADNAKTLVKADDIAHRLSEISFGSSLWAELRALALIQQEARRSFWGLGRLDRRMGRVRLHSIEAPDVLGQFDNLSRASTHPTLITALFEAGVKAGRQWLSGQGRSVGSRSTFDTAGLL